MKSPLSIVTPLGMLGTNCCVIACPDSRECIIIDPGGEPEKLKDIISNNNLKPKFIANTHAHIDHIGAVDDIKKAYGIEFGLSKEDLYVLETAPQAAAMFNLGEIAVPKVDFYLKEGDILRAGSVELKVMETPGHTKGSVCFYGHDTLFAGDTLFNLSIGRTDLPGGSHREIIDSITSKLLPLKDSTVVYPGHGDKTTIGFEKINNPHINGSYKDL